VRVRVRACGGRLRHYRAMALQAFAAARRTGFRLDGRGFGRAEWDVKDLLAAPPLDTAVRRVCRRHHHRVAPPPRLYKLLPGQTCVRRAGAAA
jgi:hypothetical protein